MFIARHTSFGHETLMGMSGDDLMMLFGELQDQLRRETTR
jgi:hypothetical protein